MHPILCTFGPFTIGPTVIGPIQIFSYGFMIALGLALSFVIIHRRGSVDAIAPDKLIDLIIVTTCIGIIGARVWYVVRFFDAYRENLVGIFKIWEGGLILYGGTITATVFVLCYCLFSKRSFATVTDAIVPYFTLTQGFGRIGCFLNGCCGGRPTDGWWGVTFPFDPARVHPAQLYESAFDLTLAVVLLLVSARCSKRRPGLIIVLYFLVYPVGRFLIEFTRINPPVFAGFSEAQLISIALFTGAAVFFVAGRMWKQDYVGRADDKL